MKVAGCILVGLALLFWAGIAWRVLRYPENHTGFSVLWALPLFAAMALLAVWPTLTGGQLDGQGWILLGLGVVSAAAVALIYQFNVLLPYEVWLKRGMPPRPF